MTSALPCDLLITSQGKIYHLNLKPEDISDTIIMVGDPDRVNQVSSHFDTVELKVNNREFVTHTGYFAKKRITVISTGIGTDNIDIVLNELDALVNINFENRVIKDKLTKLTLIRIGTSGAIQPEIALGTQVLSNYAIGLDELGYFYKHPTTHQEQLLSNQFKTLINIPAHFYVTTASNALVNYFKQDFTLGITVTTPGFYGPQGRVLRENLTITDFIKKLQHFSIKKEAFSSTNLALQNQEKICNFDMETAGIYLLGKILNHDCLSISLVVNNRITHKYYTNYHPAMEKLIANTLEKIVSYKVDRHHDP